MSRLQDVIIAAGLAAARPAAGSEGRLYYSTDTPILERDTGAAWEQYAPGGGMAPGTPRAGVASDNYYSGNLIKNSPGQIVVDGAEPQWWDDSASATITDEDTAGEGIADIHERCFKVVTVANDVYGYQTFTLADEEVLDAGVTIVSFGCWVYCATGAKASIGIFGTNLTLQESVQAGAGAWEWLEVTNITLNAADATIQVRLIVDTDTAWFTMPMFAVGPAAQPWVPRRNRLVAIQNNTVVNLAGQTDIPWTDIDYTAATDPLAFSILGTVLIMETGVSGATRVQVGHSDDVIGADSENSTQYVQTNAQWIFAFYRSMVNDGQVGRYFVNEQDADNDVSIQIRATGYWIWS